MKRILVGLGLISNILLATDYGFIVAIGAYQSKNIINLHKIEQDISTYESILKKWNLNKNSIYILKDKNATKKNILGYLNYIARNININDRFFMFYSGHGVSLADEEYGSKLQQAGLTQEMKNSGAILPYDFNGNNIRKTIIMGKELRAYLTTIDKKVSKSLIVFDACFSKNSIKDIRGGRSVNRTPNILTKNDNYPYKNIVYIASSIIESKPGKFSPILNACLGRPATLVQIKQCINREIGNSMQIPAILSNNREDILF